MQRATIWEASESPPAALRIAKLNKWYSKVQVLDGIDMVVQPEKIHGLMTIKHDE